MRTGRGTMGRLPGGIRIADVTHVTGFSARIRVPHVVKQCRRCFPPREKE